MADTALTSNATAGSSRSIHTLERRCMNTPRSRTRNNSLGAASPEIQLERSGCADGQNRMRDEEFVILVSVPLSHPGEPQALTGDLLAQHGVLAVARRLVVVETMADESERFAIQVEVPGVAPDALVIGDAKLVGRSSLKYRLFRVRCESGAEVFQLHGKPIEVEIEVAGRQNLR